MTRRRIACVVEGHGEVEAVPVLIRRVAASLPGSPPVDVPAPIRIPKDKALKPKELERAVDLARRKAGPGGAVFVIFDADDDCPATLGPDLLARARGSCSDRPLGMVIAKREFEGWFLAAARSLRGRRGLDINLEPPETPEEVRGAKEWLTKHKRDGTTYAETVDQPALAATFDFEQARSADSFDKCFRVLEQLLGA